MSEKSDERKISEALNLLEEMAKNKKAELQAMVAENYTNLEELLGSFAHDLGAQVKETYEEGKDKVEGFISGVDEMVHRNPWPFIGGVAAVVYVLGILQGKSKK